jgi:hypothetical protein
MVSPPFLSTVLFAPQAVDFVFGLLNIMDKGDPGRAHIGTATTLNAVK